MQYEKASQCLSGRGTRCSLARLYTYARAQAKSVLLQLQLHGFSRVRSTVRPVANDALHNSTRFLHMGRAGLRPPTLTPATPL